MPVCQFVKDKKNAIISVEASYYRKGTPQYCMKISKSSPEGALSLTPD